MGAGVFAKLVVLVLAVGGSAVGVLALRQSRLQAAHEAAEARLRTRAHAERIMDLHAQIARLVTPEALAPYADDPALVPAIEARHGAADPAVADREQTNDRPPGSINP